MSGKRVAVVTGSNQGIGFAIVRGLDKEWDGDVILTARNIENGKKAVAALESEGLSPKFHQLDIGDHGSIVKLHDFLKENYGGLDILVNNAGICYGDNEEPFVKKVEATMKTNFWGTLDVSEILFPLLRPHSRVVQVSSTLIQRCLARMNAEKRKEVVSCKSMEDLKKLMTAFVNGARSGVYTSENWRYTGYEISKIGVTLMAGIQQELLDKMGKNDIVVNSCCPGYVITNINDFEGHLTPNQGAETPLYCAVLPPDINEPRGMFLYEKKIFNWH